MKAGRILFFDTIDSTNTYAAENIDKLKNRQVVAADLQTAGKGRLERKWISAPGGNIYASVVLKPFDYTDPPLINLSQYAALVVSDVFLEYGVTVTLKWPNDVMAEDRKIAGILGETVYRGSCFRGYILGLGVNLNMKPEDLSLVDQPAISLNMLLGAAIDRDAFLDSFLRVFFQGYESFMKLGFISIRTKYLSRSPYIGRRITVSRLPPPPQTGTAEDIDDQGRLIVGTPKGKKVVNLGDVS